MRPRPWKPTLFSRIRIAAFRPIVDRFCPQKYKKMDKNHCGKCYHLKRGKKPKVYDHGRGLSANCFFPGYYYCVTGGRWWSDRPKFDFNICEHFAKHP